MKEGIYEEGKEKQNKKKQKEEVVWYGGNNFRDISVLKGRLDEGRQR